jgi:inhibitor of growth protein 3
MNWILSVVETCTRNERAPSPAESLLSIASHALPVSSRAAAQTLHRAGSNTSTSKRSRSYQHDPSNLHPFPPGAAHPSLQADPRVLGNGSEWNAAHYAPPPPASGTLGLRGVTQELLDEVENVDGEEEDHGLYCICQKQSYGEMVGCDDDNCEFQWVRLQHPSRDGIPDVPLDSFICRVWV